MKNLVEFINEQLITESNDLWKQYTYCLKNIPKKVPFEQDAEVTEEDLVNHYDKYFKNNNISYDDIAGINLIPFEQYVLSNWPDTRLLDMKFNYSAARQDTTISIEFCENSKPRKTKGTTSNKTSKEFNIKDSKNKVVKTKDWVHAVVTFLNNNIVMI